MRQGFARAAALSIVAVFGFQTGTPPTSTAARPGPEPRVERLQLAGSTSVDVRDLPQLPGPARPSRDLIAERHAPRVALQGRREAAPVGSGVAEGRLAPAPAPGISFEGLHFTEACTGGQCGDGHPPDTNGDVGPNHYVQAINVAIGIYDKTSGSRLAGFTFNSLMSQGTFGNLCDTDNYGDPIVVYDTFRDRWVITDFAFQVDGSGNIVNPPGSYQCFAVSQSGNPVSGGWNFYSLHITDGLQDYAKLGVWPDGLYMSANMFGFAATGGYLGARVWALDLEAMEAGDPTVSVVSFDVPKVQGALPFSLLPANARVQAGAPPAGTPAYFTAVHLFTDRIRVWKFDVDWATPSNSTFTGPSDSSTGSTWGVPPNTVPSLNGNNIDTIGYRLMMQNQYANIGGVEALWMSHTVRGSSASQAAVRWYQVPVTGGVVGAALQASTWNPDANNRFMPSLAVDRIGNMAIGYSVSSSSLYPAIRYAGRLVGDAASTLGQTEQTLITGTGSQSGNCGGSPCARWGDYTAMTLDPVDGCTFWYTNQYYVTTGLDHHTRIGAFAYPSCVSAPQPTPTPSPSPTPVPTPTPTPGPTIHVGDLDSLARRTGLTSWRATITIRVHDTNHAAVAFVTVSGTWTGGYSGTSSCTTDETGSCFLATAGVPNGAASVTFSVTSATHVSLIYDSGQDHDPDVDSDGTTIVVSRPY